MKKSDLSSILAVAASALMVGLVVMDPAPVIGQGPGKGAPGKGAPGKNAAPPGPVPRTPEGKPDFSGFWNGVTPGGNVNIEPVAPKGGGKGGPGGGKGGGKGKAKGAIIDPENGFIPYTPAARAISDDIIANGMFKEPELHCYPSGVPHNMWVQFGLQTIQTPQYLVFMWEFMHSRRIIPLDNRPHQFPPHVRHLQGESVGHWEGDTLVVDTINQTNNTWFDTSGRFAPEDIHVVERFTMLNANQIKYEATVTSPSQFTQPMKLEGAMNRAQTNNPSYEQMEFACIEGNRDLEHYTEDKGGKAKNVGILQP